MPDKVLNDSLIYVACDKGSVKKRSIQSKKYCYTESSIRLGNGWSLFSVLSTTTALQSAFRCKHSRLE